MEQPIGFKDPRFPDKVCLLLKALYGLKQSARQWEKRLAGDLISYGFIRNPYDQSVYYLPKKEMIIVTHIDDLLIFSKTVENINDLKQFLSRSLEISDLGPAKHFLGIEIIRNRKERTITLTQKGYIERLLPKFTEKGEKGVLNPSILGQKLLPNTEEPDKLLTKQYQKSIGSLMYLMTGTRPDLSYSITYLGRFMSNPNKEHVAALQRVWRYLIKTANYGLTYYGNTGLIGYCDADWGGNIIDRRSTSGNCFLFRNATISWTSQSQKTVALSSCEAEYMAFKEAVKEQLFLKGFFSSIDFLKGKFNPTLYTDSQSAMAISKNPVYHKRTKHIDIQYHFIRHHAEKGNIKFEHVTTDNQLADGFTKAVNNQKWLKFTTELGLTGVPDTK